MSSLFANPVRPRLQMQLHRPAAPPTASGFRGGPPRRFGSLWAKQVMQVNTDRKCIDSLVGPRYEELPTGHQLRDLDVIVAELEVEAEAVAVYLCGVTEPYSYEANLHVAFAPHQGSVVAVEHTLASLTITDAKAIIFNPPDNVDEDVEHHRRRCRNWWFAHHAATELGASDLAASG